MNWIIDTWIVGVTHFQHCQTWNFLSFTFVSLTNIIRKVTYLSACGSRIDAQICRNIDNSFLSMTTVRSVNFFSFDLFTKPRRELIHETVYRFTSCNLISFCVVHLIRFVKTTANWPFHSEIVFPINTFVFSVWRKPQHSQIHLTNRLNWHQFIVTHNNNKNTRNNTERERKPHTVVECFANQWQYYVAHSKKIYCFYSVYSRFLFCVWHDLHFLDSLETVSFFINVWTFQYFHSRYRIDKRVIHFVLFSQIWTDL